LSGAAHRPDARNEPFWKGWIMLRRFIALGVAALAAASGDTAHAAQPVSAGYNLQAAATQVASDIAWFHSSILIPIITAVTLLVLALLAYCAIRFRASANPVPSKTTHNVVIEVVWTLAPIIILIVIAIPSFKLLYEQQTIPKADLTVKAIGYQWYWGYAYPDHGNFAFDSYVVQDKDRKDPVNQPRLLAVDNEMVVPVGKVVRLQVTAQDVLHAFFVPSFGVQVTAVPGRLNEAWFKVERPGVYYGQCNELCGKDHSSMPIAVRALPEAEFAAWVDGAKKKFAASQSLDVANAQQAGR